jgi:hypothetical protein
MLKQFPRSSRPGRVAFPRVPAVQAGCHLGPNSNFSYAPSTFKSANRSQAGGLAHFLARLAFPSASGRRPNHGPVRLGRNGQSHFRGETGVSKTPQPSPPRKLGQSPVNGYTNLLHAAQGRTGWFHAPYVSSCHLSPRRR